MKWVDGGAGGVRGGGRAGHPAGGLRVALYHEEGDQEKTQLWGEETEEHGTNVPQLQEDIASNKS